mgnify:FL=1
MKLILEYPYNNDWKNGYLVVNGENRKTLILYNKGKRSSTSYARYIVATSIGRYLLDTEHVDHIDNDKTNDNLENLRIVSGSENNQKEANKRGRLLVEIKCPICSKLFTRRRGNTHLVNSRKSFLTFCSVECSNIFKSKNYSQYERKKMSKNSIIREFRQHEKE